MKNIIDEMHWVSINYITKNYKKILIGNMSTFLFNNIEFMDLHANP